MRRYTTLYYLLFVLIVMGAFASMAQNDYGMTILGLAAASFSVIFLVQLISMVSKKQANTNLEVIEVGCLFILTAIMAMRVFYIRFEFVEYVFAAAGIVLALVYLQKMQRVYTTLKADSKKLSVLVLIFYSSVILYLISMITVPFLPAISEPIGMIAFVLMLLSAIGNLIIGTVIVNSEKTTGFQVALKFRDRSMVLLTLFVLFSAYMAFTKVNLVPKLYSDEFPQSYYELVNHAETGNETPVDGKFKHETFKENYEKFLKRNPVSE